MCRKSVDQQNVLQARVCGVCCSLLQCVAGKEMPNVLQCVAVCCSVLQFACVAVYCSLPDHLLLELPYDKHVKRALYSIKRASYSIKRVLHSRTSITLVLELRNDNYVKRDLHTPKETYKKHVLVIIICWHTTCDTIETLQKIQTHTHKRTHTSWGTTSMWKKKKENYTQTTSNPQKSLPNTKQKSLKRMSRSLYAHKLPEISKDSLDKQRECQKRVSLKQTEAQKFLLKTKPESRKSLP